MSLRLQESRRMRSQSIHQQRIPPVPQPGDRRKTDSRSWGRSPTPIGAMRWPPLATACARARGRSAGRGVGGDQLPRSRVATAWSKSGRSSCMACLPAVNCPPSIRAASAVSPTCRTGRRRPVSTKTIIGLRPLRGTAEEVDGLLPAIRIPERSWPCASIAGAPYRDGRWAVAPVPLSSMEIHLARLIEARQEARSRLRRDPGGFAQPGGAAPIPISTLLARIYAKPIATPE